MCIGGGHYYNKIGHQLFVYLCCRQKKMKKNVTKNSWSFWRQSNDTTMSSYTDLIIIFLSLSSFSQLCQKTNSCVYLIKVILLHLVRRGKRLSIVPKRLARSCGYYKLWIVNRNYNYYMYL